MFYDQNGWIKEYEHKNALWISDKNPLRSHALLTSGMHSDGFFNSELVMEDSFLLNKAVSDMMRLIRFQNIDIKKIRQVVGPAMGAITLVHDLSRHISQESSRICTRAYVEKEEKISILRNNQEIIIEYSDLQTDDIFFKKEKVVRMVPKRTKIHQGGDILLAEDVLTTGGSVDLTAQAVLDNGGIPLPFVVVLVNRSGLRIVNGRKIIALIDQPMNNWEKDECPLCKQGSEAIHPKVKGNWYRLNAIYSN